MRARTVVPEPGELDTSSSPPRRAALSRIERRPRWPGKSAPASKPRPSSLISTLAESGSLTRLILTFAARACLTVLCRASWAMRYRRDVSRGEGRRDAPRGRVTNVEVGQPPHDFTNYYYIARKG